MERISQNIKHPKELKYFALSRILERISHYGIRSILVLYMTNKYLNMSDTESIKIYSNFTIAIMLSPILGAFIGDMKFGNRNTSLIGLVFNIIGTILLLIPTKYCLYASLTFIALGLGLYLPNFNAQLGKYYLDRKSLMDSGFTIIYTLINIGAFLGSILFYSFLKDKMNYGFIITIFIYLGALLFQLRIKEQSSELQVQNRINHTNWKLIGIIILGISINWIVYDIIENLYNQKFMQENNIAYRSFLNFNTLNKLMPFILGIVAFLIGNYCYFNCIKKIKFTMTLLAISIIPLFIFNNSSLSKSTFSFYPSLFILSIVEVILAPIIYSVIIMNSNTKYLAILLSLPFILNRLVYEIFNKVQSFFKLGNIFILTIILIIIILYFIVLSKSERKLEVNKASI